MNNSIFKARLIMLVIAAACLVFSAGSSLYSQPKDRGHRDGMGPKGDKGPAEILKFDDEQKEQLKKLGDAHMEKMKSIGEDNHKLHEELFGLLKEDQPDRTKSDSLITLIAENRKKADEEMFSHFMDIKNLCRTDEQKKLFGEFVDNIGKMPPMGPPHMQPPPENR